MAEVSRTEVFPVSQEQLYSVIVDYERYPEFVDGVNAITVLENDESGAKVRYDLNLIKKFQYTIELNHERPERVSWHLHSGELFKKNSGYWLLEKISEKETKVTYALDVEFKIFAPKMIVKKLVTTNLPSMMKSYRDRALAQ